MRTQARPPGGPGGGPRARGFNPAQVTPYLWGRRQQEGQADGARVRRSGAGGTTLSDPRTALVAIGALDEDEIDLADAAFQLARVDTPPGSWAPARAHLSDIAREAARLEAGPDDLLGQAEALAILLAERFGYQGDRETYEDRANANLIRVIERRQGLPVALGILWLHAARAAGWIGHGLDMPGHFLIALGSPERRLAIDPFAGGGPVDDEALRRLIRQAAGAQAEPLRTPSRP